MSNDKIAQRRARMKEAIRERIAQLHVRWFAIEQSGNHEKWNQFAGELHTLKGEAGIGGIAQVAKIAHSLEDLVGLARLHATPSPDVMEQILAGLELVDEVAIAWPNDPPVADSFATIVAALRPTRYTSRPRGLPPLDADASRRNRAPSAKQTPAPPSTPPAPEPTVLAPPPAAASNADAVRSQRDSRGASAAGTIRIGASRLNQIRDLIAELHLAQQRAQGATRELQRVRDMIEELLRREKLPHNSFAANIVQNLMAVESKLRDDSFRVAQLVRDLSDANRELRLVPLRSVFETLPMAVASLARRVGRNVRVDITGDMIEIDRSVLDRLSEPLMHLLTNAVDHGIEPEAERVLNGKPGRGTISVAAAQRGSELVVTVTDDGRGVDVAAARNQTVARGMLTAEAAAAAPENDILLTLFAPGMSTRSETTELSGRGVGLAVVWDSIYSIGGRVAVRTTPGHGTSFELQVPVTIAVTAMLTFQVGSGWYALPQVAVERVLEANMIETRQSNNKTWLMYNNAWVPILELPTLLSEHDDGGHRSTLLVVRYGRELVAVTGGSAYAQREDVVRSLGGLLSNYAYCTGVVMRDDGAMLLVLNVAAVLTMAGQGPRANLTPVVAQRIKTVLIADDSPIIRDLVGETLRAHGVNVVEAADGQEAFEKALTMPHLDLVVSDVEMPRMGGIDLVRALRNSPTLPRVPVIMLSMRGSESDKQRASEAGADAYLVKSDFSHTALWQLAARFLADNGR
ncbi:MAG TPA: response regulator [Kofleriaceae bacterium]|nr:response regulator [Kofleriaceae bacterium]